MTWAKEDGSLDLVQKNNTLPLELVVTLFHFDLLVKQNDIIIELNDIYNSFIIPIIFLPSIKW